jgi:hypothetical protein
MNVQRQQQFDLFDSAAERPVQLTTEQLQFMLRELARRHSKKARHYRAAADDLGDAISVEV